MHSSRHDLDLQLTCYKESDKKEQVEWPVDTTASINQHLFSLVKVDLWFIFKLFVSAF